jgi:hypothetical protein
MLHIISNVNPSEKILNTRLDILNNSNPNIRKHYSLFSIVNFVKSKYHLKFYKNVFQYLECSNRCDNMYISTVSIMHKLINHLYNNLDDIILTRLPYFFDMNIINAQEKIFWFENNYLFDKKN